LGLAAGFLAGPSALQAGFAHWNGHPPQIESISVSGHARLTARDVALATGVARGSAVAQVDARAVEEQLAVHPWVRSAQASVLPSGELLVEIEEREPRAIVRCSSEGPWRLVDALGVPFAPAEPSLAASLPRLRSHPELAGNLEHGVLARTLAILDELPPAALRKLSPAVARTSEEAGGWPLGLELHLPAPGSHRGWVLHAAVPRLEVILGQEGVGLRLERLAQLLDSELLREVRRAETIDLRFADRAVMRPASVSR
jgi:cell division septal protein FtsQ